jgi:hypothetical protein
MLGVGQRVIGLKRKCGHPLWRLSNFTASCLLHSHSRTSLLVRSAFVFLIAPLLPTALLYGSRITWYKRRLWSPFDSFFLSFLFFFLHLTYFILFTSLGLGARLAS